MNKLVFIAGGVRSGKSAFSEKLAAEKYNENKKSIYYLATGVAFDEEMRKRILHHQQGRLESRIPWKTVEFESEIPSLELENGDIILWDCVTTWLSNVLYITDKKENRLQEIQHYIDEFKETVLRWVKQGVSVYLVSNEVLDDIESIYEEVNLYRNLLGNLHQLIVEFCDEAYEMDYGLAVRRK